MPKTLFKVDLTKPMSEQELPGHNRWHPDIPAVVSVNPGDVFRIECKDWTDGQIENNDNPDDIRDVDLTVVHVLSGPIWVNGERGAEGGFPSVGNPRTRRAIANPGKTA